MAVDTYRLVELALEANVPVVIFGSPGVGKSSRITAYARATGSHLETVIASLRDPTDFAGQPRETDNGGVTFVPPSWALRLVQADQNGQRAILFLDEITTAPPMTQAALLRLILDRECGDLSMGPNIRMIAAANPPEEAAGGWALEPPTANRFLHFTVRAQSEDWAMASLRGYPDPEPITLPDGWESTIPQVRAEVAAFVKNADAVFRFPKDAEQRSGAWPSPRSWEMGIRVLAAARSLNWGENEQLALLTAAVGPGIAGEWLTFSQNLDLPDPREVLKNAAEFKVENKDRVDRNYAILSTAGAVTMNDMSAGKTDTYPQMWKLLSRYVEGGLADLAASFVITLLNHNTATIKAKTPAEDIKSFLPMLKKAGQMP